ncbi:MAG: MBL fold metallo-hydrolase [Treponema sp.]|jgi:phosphoribosyl 1,2-cyclic phosphodiesterase|nr:MBL fold metallo-hydrolase [Treponema sp.]
MLSVRFWGVRGSIPAPGPSTIIFGGNTSCLEIRADERLVIVDLGTGVRLLGNYLMANDFKKGPIDADIFVTHTHWDHIIGFPLFSPLFASSSMLRIWGPISTTGETLESILKTQLDHNFWPIRLSELSARITYKQVQETTLDLGGGLFIKTKYLNHPALCLGYRFEYKEKSIVTVYDHEPFMNLFPTDANASDYDEATAKEGECVAKEENEKIVAFFKNADVLIHDSQYTEAEYHDGKHGWGHSFYEHVIPSVRNASIKKLVLFHHDTDRSDEDLIRLEKEWQIKDDAPSTGGLLSKLNRLKRTEVIMAKEGMTIRA